MTPVDVGVIGGSGLYELAGLTAVEERAVTTPFGPPSDVLRIGALGSRRVAFLARHGRQHTLLPSEINYCANICAMKQLGVGRLISVAAVGSLREGIAPRDLVLVDQFVDRTHARRSTFFGEGLAAHVALADPVCPVTRGVLLAAARTLAPRVHDGGTYLCMEGPAFSTRAESRLHRSFGLDVIGMTNATEAKLAREAELCYAVLALVTDYDCWHEEEEDVTIGAVLANLRANAALAARLLGTAIEHLPADRGSCRCARALEGALITPREAVPHETLARLAPILGDRLSPP